MCMTWFSQVVQITSMKSFFRSFDTDLTPAWARLRRLVMISTSWGESTNWRRTDYVSSQLTTFNRRWRHMKRKLDRSNFNNYWTIKRKSAFSGSSLVHLSTYVKRGMMWHLLSRSWLQECQIQQLCAGESDWCLVTLSDSDWTGNKSHRKSTSGGFHALNSCPLFNSSRTQQIIS